MLAQIQFCFSANPFFLRKSKKCFSANPTLFLAQIHQCFGICGKHFVGFALKNILENAFLICANMLQKSGGGRMIVGRLSGDCQRIPERWRNRYKNHEVPVGPVHKTKPLLSFDNLIKESGNPRSCHLGRLSGRSLRVRHLFSLAT